MKNNSIKAILFIAILSPVWGFCQAQLANHGDLVVTGNTVFSTVGSFTNTAQGSFINNGDVYVYNHWQNNGMIDHDDMGVTRFVGNAVQQILGSEVSYFNNLEFDNTASQDAFELGSALSVANTANFLLGVVNNRNHGGTLIFEAQAIHINTSNDSHVNGMVEKLGDQEFTYPIGNNGHYRHATITAPEALTHMFRSQYFFEDTNNNYPTDNKETTLELIDETEYWIVERAIGNSDVMITLSWDATTTSQGLLSGNLEELRIARWDEANQLWVDQGGTVDETTQTVTSVVDGYGVFTLAKKSGKEPLPCEYMEVMNLITPGEDGKNDAFRVNLAEDTCISQMDVKIYNRWGIQVFEGTNYEDGENLFKGFSKGRVTISASKSLPTGTYFYVISYKSNNETLKNKTKTGYLYIN